jgi:methyltransferase-like protein/2-polyprenyl-3-methyl-5-hydroxy-6-metoxy-1,4-benzoquinol methylase
MDITKTTTYDTVLYPGQALAQAHPDRLAMLAALFGMSAPEVETSRILELGCGDGLNLIAIALNLPNAHCVGIDLAAAGIEKGLAVIRQLGLKNVTLQQRDILEIDKGFGQFDYIIAHGLYSWVPENVRNKILLICNDNLAENGIAYVSYNTYPGAHLRNMVRDMMRYHVDEFESPQQKIQQARAIIEFIADSARDDSEVYRPLLQKERGRIRDFLDSSLYHDDLSDCNAPVYFYQFMEHAESNGLQYLCEAHFFETQAGIFPASVVDVLNQVSDSRIAKEQYLDFLKGRRFRQTLLCHADKQFDPIPRSESIVNFYIGAPVYPDSSTGDINTQEPVTFIGPKNSAIKTDNPLIKAALLHLGKIWPQSIHFNDLLDIARAGCDDTQDKQESLKILADMLLRAYAGAVVEFHVLSAQYVMQPSKYPVASPLARLQSLAGIKVTNLRHYTIKIEDPIAHRLLQLLDGSRDRTRLIDELSQWINTEKIPLPQLDSETASTEVIHATISEQLENNLIELGHLALLTA